jgi:serine/threonine protein kinase
MSERDGLNLAEGEIVALPFFDNAKFVVGSKRGGGMGNVYQLIPLVPGAPPLALKTYQGGGDFSLFEREARIWISLSGHPSVSRAITYGTLKGARCILANWYPRSVLDLNSQSLTCEGIVRFASEIVSGLKDCYEQHGLIHKDIKPSNILIDNNNAPRLADFGISSIAPSNHLLRQIYQNTIDLKSHQYDRNSSVSGTPLYMAPELFHGGKNSIKSDIYALGITLFEWIAGAHPYLTPEGKFNYTGVSTFADETRKWYGEEIEPLVKLILLAIQLDVVDRPATYSELLARSTFEVRAAERDGSSRRSERPAVFGLISRAQVLRRQGKLSEAVGLLKRELDKQPDDVLLLTNYATTLIKADQMPAAIPYLDRAVALNRKSRNFYSNQAYIEPNVNRSLLLIGAKQFQEAAELLRETARLLKEVKSDLSLAYWEFGWLALIDGRIERAVQRFAYYVSKRAAIEPVIAMFCLAAYMAPARNDYFRKFFDLISAAGCNDVMSGQYYCIIASHLDTERLRQFHKHSMPPKLVTELEELSNALWGARDGFRLPLKHQTIRQLLQSADDKYCGGKYHAFL